MEHDRPTTNLWRPGRLQTRFLLVTSLILVVVSGTIALLFHRLSVAAVEQARFQAASDVAVSLGLRLAAGIPERPVLERVLSEYVHDNSEIVAVAVLLESKGETRAGMQTQERRELVEARKTSAAVSRIVTEDDERLWSVAVPVVRDGDTIGAVGVWSSLRASELLSREARRLAVILLPASILTLVGLLTVWFRRRVQLPMEAIKDAMMRAESGEADAEAPVIRHDEIGFVARRYNQLLSTVRQNQEERERLVEKLQGFNEKLSARVKEATAELEERNLKLERMNQELYHLQRRLVRIERQSVAEHMTARVAHKIGTPLNLISGHVQLLKKSRGADRALQEKLGIIESQIDKLTMTIHEILDETRRAAFDMKPIELQRLLENTKALLEPTLSAHGVTMELRLGPAPLEVEGDEDRLEQVFLTLINNSLDAMPHGGTIEMSAETSEGSIVVRLTDDGMGIPEAMLPHIFNAFFTTKEPGRGTGLGLSIVSEILSVHHATIRAESLKGGRTTFVLEFPRPSSSNAS